MQYPDDVETNFEQRNALEGVDPMFPRRWSPRSFKKVKVAEQDLRIVVEAARWAPSAMNEQPWRIYTSTEGTFQQFLELLVPGNQAWAHNASVLGFFVAKRHYDRNGKENGTCEFDTGAAWMALALQAQRLGLYTHAMGGIERKQVYKYLNLKEKHFSVICGFALGVIDDAEKLPLEIQAREKPSPRKKLEEIWFPI